MQSDSINVGVLGCGVVGGGVVKVLLERSNQLAERVGKRIRLAKVAVRDISKPRSCELPPGLLTTDVVDVLDNPEVDIVVELLGGERPALDYVHRAIANGKHVVTANKEIVARFGPELFAAAEKRGVDLYFEASVGGGIPLIGPFKQALVANKIQSIKAIINGTTNYILTEMAEAGCPFDVVLQQAQALGYAEPNPDNDILGIDAGYKLSILVSLGFQTYVHPDGIYKEGITRLDPRDFRYARELGYAIKLLAIGKEAEGEVEARVHPVLVPLTAPLAQVNGVFNAVQVEGDLTGPVLFHGRGAGPAPTSSAVVSDIVDLAHNINAGIANRLRIRFDRGLKLRPMSDVCTRYYLRLQVTDCFGVMAQIAQVLGDNKISIASVVQKETYETQQIAELVIMTHLANEAAVQAALEKLAGLSVVREISNFIRVEG
ncbi:MAG: homoserine dehydrogenase [Chloroflexota bacterium]